MSLVQTLRRAVKLESLKIIVERHFSCTVFSPARSVVFVSKRREKQRSSSELGLAIPWRISNVSITGKRHGCSQRFRHSTQSRQSSHVRSESTRSALSKINNHATTRCGAVQGTGSPLLCHQPQPRGHKRLS
jgi:hypothetical protein